MLLMCSRKEDDMALDGSDPVLVSRAGELPMADDEATFDGVAGCITHHVDKHDTQSHGDTKKHQEIAALLNRALKYRTAVINEEVIVHNSISK